MLVGISWGLRGVSGRWIQRGLAGMVGDGLEESEVPVFLLLMDSDGVSL